MILADLASFLVCRSSSMAWIVAIREWKLIECASGHGWVILAGCSLGHLDLAQTLHLLPLVLTSANRPSRPHLGPGSLS
ncbi:hypothetical protein XELAEV_18026950mg [Xenopus laevis]|uniref:Uncharacterized protein n=1 Tax=Xenopus laevis TaxID=8355 RepID=A0A974CX05_XENLA|nr:hypothetical protein XELAEV_18026950mg [Xenopus laevis]